MLQNRTFSSSGKMQYKDDYRVQTSKRLASHGNCCWHLTSLRRYTARVAYCCGQ